jgi:high affinity Mn2+ porin
MRQTITGADAGRSNRKSERSIRETLAEWLVGLGLAAGLPGGALAADLPAEKAPSDTPTFNDPWSGLYVGGHMGYAGGRSNWSGPGVAGSIGLARSIDTFTEAGSFLTGLQAGYNILLPNRVLLGVEADATFPAYPDLLGMSAGGSAIFVSPALGPATYAEAIQASGSMRARLGYALGAWLIYGTGGFAWARNQQTLTQISSGAADAPYLWRSGWSAGAGVEVPLLPSWTARLEYLYSDFGAKTVIFPTNGQAFRSDFTMRSARLGLNYHFGKDDASAAAPGTAQAQPAKGMLTDDDRVNFHGQATFVGQGYPRIRAAFDGPNSLPRAGQFRETNDVTLYAGLRLWPGAEMWTNPEIDQGFGVGDTHGAAGFPSGESYKLGHAFPYGRAQRYFVRQTINLGGATQKVDADLNQFAGTLTENHLVLTIGKFAVVDIFDTNKYATNPKNDFLNWSLINAGTFDYAGDGWGYTYGAAAEWYQGRFALRGGVFDLSGTPAGGALNGPGYGLDPNLSQYQLVGEIEERHDLWGQPGKLKVTGYLSRGRAGSYQDAVTVANATGLDPSLALALDRGFRSRPGVSVNLEQQVADDIGVFARAGYADGNVEPWDFADIDRTVQAGVSITGRQWGRPDDTVGVAGVVNGLSGPHRAYLAAGGVGLLIGDGQLPSYRLEKIAETYYNYALTPNTKLGLDYQLIANPGYNGARGPANFLAARLHWQF